MSRPRRRGRRPLPIAGALASLTILFLEAGPSGCGQPPGNSNLDGGLDALAACPPYDAVISSPVPIRIEGLEDVVDVAAGWDHHCAVTGSGEVYCWGSNCYGALGNDIMTRSATPVLVEGIPPAKRVFVPRGGWRASCAFTTDRQVWCWGLGDEVINGTPTSVHEQYDIVEMSMGGQHICYLDPMHTLMCWGSNTWDQLGLGENAPRLITTPVEPIGDYQFDSVYCSTWHTCAATIEGLLLCWGDAPLPGRQAAPMEVEVVPPIQSFGAGFFHDCLVDGDGNVWCWGSNSAGQIGAGAIGLGQSTSRFIQQPDVEDATEVAPGAYSTCALLQDGTVTCWGSDFYGQRGDGEIDQNLGNGPSMVVGLDDALKISSGKYLVCVISSDGSLWCWGEG
ncbi:MAG: hypothetical protein ABI333_12445 [bacterium]